MIGDLFFEPEARKGLVERLLQIPESRVLDIGTVVELSSHAANDESPVDACR